MKYTSVSTIRSPISDDLSKYGMNHEYLNKNLVGFIVMAYQTRWVGSQALV